MSSSIGGRASTEFDQPKCAHQAQAREQSTHIVGRACTGMPLPVVVVLLCPNTNRCQKQEGGEGRGDQQMVAASVRQRRWRHRGGRCTSDA